MRFQYQCILSIRLACRSFALIAAAENQVNLPRRKAKRADLFRKKCQLRYRDSMRTGKVKYSLSISLTPFLTKQGKLDGVPIRFHSKDRIDYRL